MSYEKAEGIRRSDLWLIHKTPLHFRHAMDNDRERTKALIFGGAVHAYILEPETFRQKYVIAPDCDRRTKDGRAEWADFLDLCAETGAEAITVDEMQTINEMAAALKRDTLAASLLIGEHEKEFYWTDAITGEKCKCKVDCITEGMADGQPIIVDYKTTDSCEDGHFDRSAAKYGYQFQAGMYTEGVFQNTLTEHRFAFVAQEKTAPYAVRVYFCDPEWVKRGYDKFRELIGIYHQCNETGIWPGYGIGEFVEV